MNKVELSFKEKGIPRVGTYVYPKQVAIDFIDECKKFNIGILGIDALIIHGEFTEPSLENSVDFTATPYREKPPINTWGTAVTFLKERDDLYYFEIICSDDPEAQPAF
ncbi:MAG: hypothetical protein ACHQIM_05545 [Sphingobacteriales bacterium]